MVARRGLDIVTKLWNYANVLRDSLRDAVQVLDAFHVVKVGTQGVCCIESDGASVGSGGWAGHMASASSVNAVARPSGGAASVASS